MSTGEGRPYLFQCHVPPEALSGAVEAFKGRLTYLYFESESTIDLQAYRPPDPSWTHGRAFGPELEVRWDKTAEGFDLLLLTEMELEPSAGWERVTAPLPVPDVAVSSQIVLWGTHVSKLRYPHRLAGGTDSAWIETRIPRPLDYPVAGTPTRVRASVMVYQSQGKPLLTRLVAVEGDEDEPETLW